MTMNHAKTLLTSEGRGWKGLEAEFLRIPAGKTLVPGTSSHRLGIHFGSPVNADCRCDGYSLRRVQKHGDIDIVPAGLDGSWEDDGDCSILRLRIVPDLFRDLAADLGLSPAETRIKPVFQLRDTRIEAIAWAIKADLEADSPAGPLFAESLGIALAVRLLEIADEPGKSRKELLLTLSSRQRGLVVEFVEAHIDQPLTVLELAALVGLRASHFKTLFRNSFGVSVHQYVIRSRVERARALLLSGHLPMSQVALEAGFAHQSHMATCMRRVLGVTPSAIVRLRN